MSVKRMTVRRACIFGVLVDGTGNIAAILPIAAITTVHIVNTGGHVELLIYFAIDSRAVAQPARATERQLPLAAVCYTAHVSEWSVEETHLCRSRE